MFKKKKKLGRQWSPPGHFTDEETEAQKGCLLSPSPELPPSPVLQRVAHPPCGAGRWTPAEGLRGHTEQSREDL